jgi:aspartyl-tRNA(Asn)/glutamyl-tRNA(Gln) amidotransferase subunit A
MTELTNLTLADARERLAKKEITALELTDAHIGAVEAARALNAFVKETPDQARDMARASDAKLQKGEGGLLEGIPLGIKDLFCTKGVRTTACSKILDEFTPTYESTVTSHLWRDGAVMLGKLNNDEFAMGSSNETSCFGPVVNPWRRKGSNVGAGSAGQIEGAHLVPGGSSGGSASAVAARLCLGATATDTGGSIRQPAAFTGTVGLKPTYGRCSRWGIVAFASSLDQAGPIAKTVEDAAMLLQSMAGHDPKDSTSLPNPLPDFRGATTKSIKGMTIGVPHEYRMDGMPDEIEEVWRRGIEWAKDAGAKIKNISLKHTKYALPAYYIVAPAEASSNLARYDGMRYGARVGGRDLNATYENTRAAGFGAEVQRRILIGTYVLSAGYYDAYYLRAQKVRQRIAQDFREAFNDVDAILTPATPSAAFGLGEKGGDPVAMYLNDIFTVTANLTGLPALALPAALDKQGLPLGLQVIGKALDEESVFAVSAALEKAAGFRAKPTKWWM